MLDPSGLRLVHRPTRAGRASRRRVGLDGVLARLDRAATWVEVPGEAAVAGLRWEDRDVRTPRWYPQGISSHLDPSPDVRSPCRDLLLTSWYGHGAFGYLVLGSRLSVIELGPSPRYAHVSLVEPRTLLGLRRLRRVPVHAGGLAWYGDHLFVAASGGGLRVFRPRDIECRRTPVRGRGTRLVAPQIGAYRAEADEGVRGMVFSFLSLQRGSTTDYLVAGEYGRKGSGRHRLVRFALDRSTGLLADDGSGEVQPVDVVDGVPRMQGAAVVDGTWFITASTGEGNPGDLWVGRPGDLVRHRGVLPTGPEDITVGPGPQRLWTSTEWPGRRWVLALDGDHWRRQR